MRGRQQCSGVLDGCVGIVVQCMGEELRVLGQQCTVNSVRSSFLRLKHVLFCKMSMSSKIAYFTASVRLFRL